MKVIEDKLLFSTSELINIGASKNTLHISASRQRKNGGFLYTHNKIGKEVYFYYDGLPIELQTLINENLAQQDELNTTAPTLSLNIHPTAQTPQKKHSSQKVRNFESHLERKPCDIEFIQTYKVAGKLLPYETVRKYIESCAVLDFVGKMSIKRIKQLGYKNCKEFFSAAINHINTNSLPLPTSEARLRSKANLYIKQGAISVISKRFGKSNNQKVGAVQEALILELIGKHNQFDSSFIAKVFNNEAIKQGWDTICRRTVLKVFSKNKLQITGSRNGIAAFRNSFDHTIKRQRPSAPNLLWVSDAWDFELFYQKRITDKKGNTKISYHERKKVSFVIDAYNDYILGYSVGDSENVELIKMAFKDACMKQGVLPYQIKTDSFSKSQLVPFYQQLCYKTEFYTPSSIGNPRDKVIERMFAQFYNEVVRQYPNASGRNITAKEQPNRDYLNSIKHTFPQEFEVIQQIEKSIHAWNTMPREKHNGLSKEQYYLQGEHSKDRKLTDIQRLDFFGVQNKRLNTYTKEGLVVTINGNTLTYRDWSNKELMDSIGVQFQVFYEPSDLSKILIVADNGRVKHLVEQERLQPMALMDMKKGDRTLLNQRLNEKQRNIQENVIDKANERANLLKEANINIPLLNDNSAEGLQKLMPIVRGKQKGNIEQSENYLKGDNDRTPWNIVDHLIDTDTEYNIVGKRKST